MSAKEQPILAEACALAEFVYSQLDELPEEEKWQSGNKLRTAANDLMFYTAQAVGNATPTGADYEWGNASKAVVALKTLYRFASRQKYLELNPDIMVRLDAILKQIDKEVAAAHKKTQAQTKKDMEDWLKRYKIWSETKL